MSGDNIEKIKERIDIVELISGYIKLQKAGLNFKACCPFHNEKTPSFYVTPERQIWHCFGCNAGGSIFDFVMQSEGIEFPEALKILADKAGIELGTFNKEFQNERVRLIEICQRAAKFFKKQLWESNSGKKALAYLKDRKVEEKSIESFGLGFAPNSWDALLIFLKNSGYSAEDIEKAGLVLKKEKGSGHYDRFRSRIIFPILDLNSQTVGFTGRIFGETSDAAKYINTPQTAIYDKSRILYGLDRAKMDIRKNGKCIVVEGNMDVIMSHQVGVTNAVASSGTALTVQHLNILKRYSKNINFCFDSDSAGLAATERGIAMALTRGFNVNVVSLDDSKCKDPADYIKLYGSKWAKKSSKGEQVVEFYIKQAIKDFDSENIEGKKLIISKVLPVIKSVSNTVEQSHWLSELSLKLKAREEDLRREMEKVIPLINIDQNTRPTNHSPQSLDSADANIVENYAISLLLKNPLWYKENHDKVNKIIFSNTARLVLDKLKNYDAQNLNISQFINDFDEKIRKKMEIWYLQSQAQWMDIDELEFEKEFLKITSRLQKLHVLSKRINIEQEIKQAEKSGNREKVNTLIKQFNEISF